MHTRLTSPAGNVQPGGQTRPGFTQVGCDWPASLTMPSRSPYHPQESPGRRQQVIRVQFPETDYGISRVGLLVRSVYPQLQTHRACSSRRGPRNLNRTSLRSTKSAGSLRFSGPYAARPTFNFGLKEANSIYLASSRLRTDKNLDSDPNPRLGKSTFGAIIIMFVTITSLLGGIRSS